VHSAEAIKVEPSGTSSTPNRSLTMTESADGKEVYTSSSARSRSQQPAKISATPVAPPVPTKKVEEADDLKAIVPEGTPCQRAGCKVTFVSDEENRTGDGPGTKCVYHPEAVRTPSPCMLQYTERHGARQPIFHEGSKVVFRPSISQDVTSLTPRRTFAQGYFCCKRRVLEFEEFLKIEGCAEGRHLFVRKSNGDVRDTLTRQVDDILVR
jgi:CHORD